MTIRNLVAIIISILFISCSKKQELIHNQDRVQDIQRMLTVQKELTSKSLQPIWDIFNQPLSESEKPNLNQSLKNEL